MLIVSLPPFRLFQDCHPAVFPVRMFIIIRNVQTVTLRRCTPSSVEKAHRISQSQEYCIARWSASKLKFEMSILYVRPLIFYKHPLWTDVTLLELGWCRCLQRWRKLTTVFTILRSKLWSDNSGLLRCRPTNRPWPSSIVNNARKADVWKLREECMLQLNKMQNNP